MQNKKEKKDPDFEKRNKKFVKSMARDPVVRDLSNKWFMACHQYEYSYHFSWLGRPIIQYPQDIIAIQEIIWKVKPDLIIETGIAHGGSLIFSASILELIGKGSVLGIDIDIRKNNKKSIENHPMSKRIFMLQGSSVDRKIVNKVKKFAKGKNRVLVFLDSDHSYDHVVKELKFYSPLVKKGGYLVVFDTVIENFPNNWLQEHGINRQWNKRNNPKIAVREFLKNNKRFKVDRKMENKLLITVAPEGFLKCVKNG